MALTRATDKIIANADGNLNLSGIVTASSFSGSGANLSGINTAFGNSSVNTSGIITATSFFGDGSNLTNLPAGLGTALSSTQTSPLNKLYYTNEILSIGATVTVDHPATGTGAYTQYADIRLEEGADLIISDGDDVIPDILGLGTDGGGLGAGGTGRIRVDSITNKNANGAPNFPNGLTGTAGTFTGNLNVGGVLTYEDVTNVDSVGIITARDDIKIITDNKKLKIGAGGDLELYHNGTDSYIANGTNNFRIGNTGSTNIKFFTNNSTRWNVDGSGHFVPDTDSQVDIGTNSVRVRNIYADTLYGSGANLTNITPPFIGEGGIESTYESGGTTYMLHTFLTTGVFRTNGAKTIDFLLVGGGGGSAAAEGNSGASGGGGGGGIVEGSGFSLSSGTYVVTVGAGGAATNIYTVGGTGGDTTFAGVTAKGGGGGADYASVGGTGGSGGGGGEPNKNGGATNQSSQNSGISNITQFGYAGGQGGEYTSNPTGGGGGGGAGGAGARPTSTDHGNGVGGAAGAGRANSITGTSTTYGRGGIGGGSGYLNAEAGLNGRGDGATGATAAGTEGDGAVGGTGIVIIRYTI